jgi:hypothetical protein
VGGSRQPCDQKGRPRPRAADEHPEALRRSRRRAAGQVGQVLGPSLDEGAGAIVHPHVQQVAGRQEDDRATTFRQAGERHVEPKNEVEADEQAQIHDEVRAPANAKEVSEKGRGVGKDDDRGSANPHQAPKEEIQRCHTPLSVRMDHLHQSDQDKGQEEKLSGSHSVDLSTLVRTSFIKVCSPTLKL